MLAPPQMSVPLGPNHSLWYESMQDMSGFVLSDIILPPLDEQLNFSNSTAQTENDFYVQNPGLPSPTEFILGDTFEGVISEDSDLFDNSNYDPLDPKINECRSESPINHLHSQSITTTNMGDEDRYFSLHEDPFCRHKAKFDTDQKDKPRYLAIIDSEEPIIKEDPDLLYSAQNKMDFDIKADVRVSDVFGSEEPSINEDMDKVYLTDFKDMDVAEEVIVTTEEEDEYKTNLDVSLLDSVPSDPEEDINIAEEKIKKESEVVFQLDPFSGLETVMDNLFNDMDSLGDALYSQIEDNFAIDSSIKSEEIKEVHLNRHTVTQVNDPFSSSPNCKITPSSTNALFTRSRTDYQIPLRPSPKHIPLTLDIGAARAALLVEKGMSDTPELLEALKPEVGKFDLIKFITTNESKADPNNNNAIISPSVESCPKKSEAHRKGKSHLSLLDLKQAQKLVRGKPLSKVEDEREEDNPLPSTSGTFPSGRPARQSATRFKKMIEEGLLSSVEDSRSVSSDDEDNLPKAKRRRTTSTTSSRRRLNSDSDHSSISEDAMKYRERRDRNNLSSKRSRQKKKIQYQKTLEELKELEDRNTRLRLKVDGLESLLTRVKAAWAIHLVHMKDNDKDRGDEH